MFANYLMHRRFGWWRVVVNETKTKSKKQKKRKKVTPYRKLYLRAEKLWKEIAFMRDGRECQVKKHNPHINVLHSEILQVDHCITRKDKNFFFDPRNSTVVCKNCNGNKNWNVKGVAYAIEQIVINREGLEVFRSMMKMHQTGSPNLSWKKIFWIEEQVEKLEAYKQTIVNQKGEL